MNRYATNRTLIQRAEMPTIAGDERVAIRMDSGRQHGPILKTAGATNPRAWRSPRCALAVFTRDSNFTKTGIRSGAFATRFRRASSIKYDLRNTGGRTVRAETEAD